MSNDGAIPRALHICIPLLVFSCNAVATSTDFDATDVLPLQEFTSKQPVSLNFLNNFLHNLGRHRTIALFPHLLMKEISLKLLVHRRRSCKKISQREIRHWETHEKLLKCNMKKMLRTPRFYNKCNMWSAWVSFNLHNIPFRAPFIDIFWNFFPLWLTV